MTELWGVLLLLVGMGALAAAGALAACCLRLRSPIEFVLGAYVIAWVWLVAAALALSPLHLLTRGSLLFAIALGLVLALGAWLVCDRPQPPSFRAAGAARRALRSPAVVILAVAVSVGAAYSSALAFLTPANDGDALAYHLSRAAFWKQEQGLGYVANAIDLRLNINPPNAEIGQLATMLLSGSGRYVALPQLGAYAALILCVVALARRLGLSQAEALFGALAFATLPVVVIQASSALNDLVVASFLGCGAVFALRAGRGFLVLLAVAVGLAVGTKFTAVLALPTLVLIAALGRPRRDWARIGLAGIGGLALGSAWYIVNLAETGDFDGGLADAADQRIELSASAVATNAMRYVLDLVDMSGARRPYAVLFVVAACVLAGLGVLRLRRSAQQGVALLVASVLTVSAVFAPQAVEIGQRAVLEAWATFGRPSTPPFVLGWGLNTDADPVFSWYGPLGALLLVLGTGYIVYLRVRGSLPTLSLGLALAPWVLLLTLAITIVWDPFRGRFLVFAFALAAATWGVLLRSRIAPALVAAVGVTMVGLALANHKGKPSGLSELWAPDQAPVVSVRSIWGAPRAEAQTRLRPEEGEEVVYRFLEERVPADAVVAVAPRENDFLSPYFGPRLSRHVSLVSRSDGEAPGEAQWLVVSPSARVRRCADSWRRELEHVSGWRIERRTSPDNCLELVSDER